MRFQRRAKRTATENNLYTQDAEVQRRRAWGACKLMGKPGRAWKVNIQPGWIFFVCFLLFKMPSNALSATENPPGVPSRYAAEQHLPE